MTLPLQEFPLAMLIGIGATAVMDAWLLLLKHLGVPTLNFAFIGRWVGHLLRGQFAHAAIAKAAPIRGELAWGWLTHYAVGMAFATVLVGIQGADWVRSPHAAQELPAQLGQPHRLWLRPVPVCARHRTDFSMTVLRIFPLEITCLEPMP